MTFPPTATHHERVPTPTDAAAIRWTAASRDPRQLWRLAGFGDRYQALWFAVYSIRPPLMSDSAVPVVAQITAPLSASRRALAIGGLLVAGGATGAILPSQPLVAAVMILMLVTLASRVATRALHGGVDADHVRLHDIVARERRSGDGERSLRSLLGTVDRGVELDVEGGRPGLVAMYSRLGFGVADSAPGRPGLIRMTRPGATAVKRNDRRS